MQPPYPESKFAMKPTKSLPDSYRQDSILDLSKNKRLVVGLNVLGTIFLLIFGAILLRLVLLLRYADSHREFYGHFGLGLFLGVVGISALSVILHELIHGAFFWHYTSEKARFGFKGLYAYAAAPEWFIPRQKHIIITLAPLIGITTTGLLLLLIVPTEVLPFLFFSVIVNLAGSIGDVVIVGWLLTKPQTAYVNDYGDGVSVYVSHDETRPLIRRK
jgi:hypothetical protein